MNQYHVDHVLKEGFTVIVLRDAGTDSTAEVVPEIGNNLFRFGCGGRQVLESPVSLDVLKNEKFAATMYGLPIVSAKSGEAWGVYF